MTTHEKIGEILRSVQSMGYNQAISDGSDAHTESGAIYVDEALPQIETLINQARKEAAIEELESAQLAVQYHAKSKELSDKGVILATTKYMKGRIKALKEGK